MTRAIWWVRRDLRLRDNQALLTALEAAQEVIPVFILDPKLLASSYVGQKRLAFLYAGLRQLDADLRRQGSYLVVRRGDPLIELKGLMDECQAEAIFAEPDISPYARQRDEKVTQSLPINWVGGPSMHPLGAILKSNGSPYTVFTPFSRAWKAFYLPQAGIVPHLPSPIHTPAGLPSLPLPDAPETTSFPAGEAEALRRLDAFVYLPGEGSDSPLPPVYGYSSGRNRPDLEATSGLSPYLRFGMLLAKTAVSAALHAIQLAPDAEARQSAETWLNELIWREFYLYILFHYPHVRRQNFRMQHIQWVNDPDQFQVWSEGRTGYPIVDAAMRQLAQTGWMHNRLRMIAASFLTKDLLVDWRWGERWFMQHLIDGDPASNNGGWQWTAGTGTDAAPYFRIFNPVTQGMRHDPQGSFIRRWLPELARVPAEYIHEPWKMPVELQKSCQCWIGTDYPAPIIKHVWARDRALRVYGQAGSSGA
ncbi:MAG: deoxyribodipyrimidine photo-lyase [Anaerolineales bacterium]|nr:deoxyribodipyrimidine photo-lyase [Anaerolineales bacterium]